MDHLQQLTRQVSRYLFFWTLLGNVLISGAWWMGVQVLHLGPAWLVNISVGLLAILYNLILSSSMTHYVLQPIQFLWQAILHVSPEHVGTSAPDLDSCKLGRELVTSLSMQVYQLASTTESNRESAQPTNMARAESILSNVPLPLLAMDKDQKIIVANKKVAEYLSVPLSEIIGQNIYAVLNLSFPNKRTFDVWLNESRTNRAIDSESWERVRLISPDQKTVRQFDMAAFYNKDNPTGVETIITIFDHTKLYGQDDKALGFIALAVHELRAPLTLLRGYIEVFEEELEGKLDAELQDFMHKMKASAEMLDAFVNNILNVARVEDNQLILQLTEENWEEILHTAGNDLALRAQIHGKVLEFDIAPDLPTVAVDRVSIYEVINNLVDNAVKYSGPSQKIIIKSWLSKDGMIETTVKDFGVGIPDNLKPKLFDKFYRSHRTQTQASGTGLGLYLSKAIITALGGQIWVESKEGQGSTFGFSLQPYSSLAEELKNNDNKGIVRGAHGWIKNHSLYRR